MEVTHEPAQAVTVRAYREQTREIFDLVNAWHACVDSTERDLWLKRAEPIYKKLHATSCARATPSDIELRQVAVASYLALTASSSIDKPGAPLRAPAPITSSRTSTQTRAGNYNRSPGRAVRLRRAARSAMRRGYF